MTGHILPLYPYQAECVAAFEAAWAGDRRPSGEGSVERGGAAIATGGGKTRIFTHLAAKAARRRERTLVFVHREDLADQAAEDQRETAPELSVGVVKADRRELDAQVVVASIQTLLQPSRLAELGGDFGLIVVDELHHYGAPSWHQVVASFAGRPLAGFTATFTRSGGVPLLGEHGVVQELVFQRSITDLISGGYLVDLKGIRVQVADLDLAAVKSSRGDLSSDDLGDAFTAADAPEQIAQAYRQHAAEPGGDPRRGVVFAPNIATMHQYAEAFEGAGIPAATIDQHTERVTRRETYNAHRAGDLRAIVNVGVLTEGWNAPWTEVCVPAPTTSRVKYPQMVGRVTRLWPLTGKTHGLVLDPVGVSARMDLASMDDLAGTPLEPGESLTEARKRAADAGEAEPDFLIPSRGELVHEEFDPFSESLTMFLEGPRGYWFVPVRDAVYYLQPLTTGDFSVCRLPGGGKRFRRDGGTDATVLERHVSFELGCAWAEKYAAEEDPSISMKSAPWRSRGRPTKAQEDFLYRQGLFAGRDYETKSEASNLISQIVAGRMGL